MPLPFKQVTDLSYSVLKSSTRHCTKPIIINLHGFLGSRNTFHELNRAIKKEIDTDIYTVDLRNHGKSPQCHPMTYEVLNNDLNHFIENEIGRKTILDRGINIIGFSMGAKVGLLNAIKSYRCHNIKKIVSIDMPPYVTPLLPTELTLNIQLIKEIHEGKIKIEPGSKTWKEECIGMLGWYFGAGFINVKSNDKENGDDHIRYYLPIEEFPNILCDLKQWPNNLPPVKDNETEVLFLRGLFSPLFTDDYSLLDVHFPYRRIIEFSAGHSLLFEQFNKASKVIVDFLKGK